MSAAASPKMRQAFALAHAVPHRKNKKAIAHRLVEVLREAIREGRNEMSMRGVPAGRTGENMDARLDGGMRIAVSAQDAAGAASGVSREN